jgi:ribosomal protein S18 acetylase RimI-like enzyme
VNAEINDQPRSDTATANYTLRPVDDAQDEQFLSKVYASTRDDLMMTGLPPEQLRMLVEMQQRAQGQHYSANHPTSEHYIVCLEGEDIGRLIVERLDGALTLVDVALLPEFRRRGIGGAIISDLINEAASSQRAFVLHVIKTNPAVDLYQRLGCEITDDLGMHYRMERRPRAGDTTV